MKCPFRPVVTTSKGIKKKETITEFADCYQHKCPYFHIRTSINIDKEKNTWQEIPICRRAK